MNYDYSYKKNIRSPDALRSGSRLPTLRSGRRERKKGLKKYITISLLLILLFLVINNLFLKPKSPKTPIVVSSGKKVEQQNNPIVSNKPIAEQIQEILNSRQGNYSVLIVNYTTGERVAINETAQYTAASTIKIPTLAGLYYFVSLNYIDLDKTITLQSKDIQDYGTGVLRYQKPGMVYSIKTLARILIEKSDNTADYILSTQVIGVKKLQDLLNKWGLTQTNISNNKTSNIDLETLLKMMYDGEIASSALTTEMIGFMDDSDFEDRIPALLPENTKVYHKIGNEVRMIHDVGIVESPKAIYYIGVLSSDITSDRDAIDTIAQISKITYYYFNR